jgi:hypothetical protein
MIRSKTVKSIKLRGKDGPVVQRGGVWGFPLFHAVHNAGQSMDTEEIESKWNTKRVANPEPSCGSHKGTRGPAEPDRPKERPSRQSGATGSELEGKLQSKTDVPAKLKQIGFSILAVDGDWTTSIGVQESGRVR